MAYRVTEKDHEESRQLNLSTDEMMTMLSNSERGDQLADYCLATEMPLVDIFTPMTRKQAINSP